MGSIGFIEAKGQVAAYEPADAMVKAANVELLGMSRAGGGPVKVACRGDVGERSKRQ